MNLYELKTEDFVKTEFVCSCGKKHKTETKEVFFGEGAIGKLLKTLQSTGAKDLLFVTAEDVYTKYGKSIEQFLRKAFRIKVHVFPSGFVPTLMRVAELSDFSASEAVVCLGSGSVVDVSKYFCSVNGVPLICVLTAPCADLSGYSNLMLDGKSERLLAVSPYAVIADNALIRTAPPAMIASAFGWMAGTALSLFEWKFAYLIGREEYCHEIAKFSEDLVRTATKACQSYNEGNADALTEFTECVLKHSFCAQLLKNNRLSESSATLAASVLQSMKEPAQAQGSLLGERVLVCANKLIPLFSAALSADVKVPIIPVDKARRANLLAKICGTDAAKTLKKTYSSPKLNLEVARYKIGEYRKELLSELQQLERLFTNINRVFKRMYPDSGFWLNKLQITSLRTAIYLAPDLSDTFTVLTFLRDEGILEYLA